MPKKTDNSDFWWIGIEVDLWLRDTAICSPMTRGIWFDAICAMWRQGRTGMLRGTADQLARICRCSPAEMQSAIEEIENTNVADVKRDCNGVRNDVVTLINRRMQREHNEREAIKLRVTKHRGNGACNADVTAGETPLLSVGNGNVTDDNYNQSNNKREGGADSESKSPPIFEPVKRGLFLREYDALITDAKAAAKAVRESTKSYVFDLSDDAVALISTLRSEAREGFEQRIKEIETDPRWKVKSMKPQALAAIQAWQERVREIQAVKAGVTR